MPCIDDGSPILTPIFEVKHQQYLTTHKTQNEALESHLPKLSMFSKSIRQSQKITA